MLPTGEVVLTYVPLRHGHKLTPATLEDVPVGQVRQAALAVAAVVGEYVPAGQARQSAIADAAVVVEYVPVGQARQVAISVAAVVAEYVPVTQSVHAALPVAILYFPATQVVHGVGMLVNNAVISDCTNTLSYIRMSPTCPAKPRPVSPLFATVKSLILGNVCPAAPVPVARCVPSIYNIADTGFALDNV